MKPLHESEVNFLESIDRLWSEYEKLPKINLGNIGGNEPSEMKKRFDEIRYIIAIRGMLRDGIKENRIETTKTNLLQ